MNRDIQEQADLRVSLVQAAIRWREPETNRRHLGERIADLPPTDLVVLPETFTTGFLGDTGDTAEDMNGPTIEWMRSLAREKDCALAGSVAVSEGGTRFNRLLFVSPDGGLEWYDKRHLFSYGGEDQRYTRGRRRVLITWRGWRINPQVCYDLRFPVWCRNRDDYDLMLVVANWPSARVAAWRCLLRARAIENQACVIGVNRCGEDGNGVAYSGRSAAWDAMGQGLCELGEAPGTATVTLLREALDKARSSLPFQRDRDTFQLTGD